MNDTNDSRRYKEEVRNWVIRCTKQRDMGLRALFRKCFLFCDEAGVSSQDHCAAARHAGAAR